MAGQAHKTRRRSLRHFWAPLRQCCRVGAALVLALPLFCAAAPQAGPRVRVGYWPMDGFLSMDAQGNFSGYGYEYLEELASGAGWELDFIKVQPGEEDALMVRGEIDLFGPRVRCPAAKNVEQLPLLSAGVLWAELLARENDARFALGQLPTTLSVGVLAAALSCGSGTGASLAEHEAESPLDSWSRKTGIRLSIRYFQTVEDLEAAFRTGSVDVMLGNSLNKVRHVHVVARFAAQPFYGSSTFRVEPICIG